MVPFSLSVSPYRHPPLNALYICYTRLSPAEEKLHEMTGPGFTERWSSWKYCTREQETTSAIKTELERLLGFEKIRKPHLSPDEVTATLKNLQAQKVPGITEDKV